MSYYTNFELDVFEGTADLNAVLARLNQLVTPGSEKIYYFEVDELDNVIRSRYALPWYDHDENITALSLEFPGVVFRLHGEGELTDIWYSYYQNGKCQICRAQMVFPPFDPTKLKSVDDAQEEDYRQS